MRERKERNCVHKKEYRCIIHQSYVVRRVINETKGFVNHVLSKR